MNIHNRLRTVLIVMARDVLHHRERSALYASKGIHGLAKVHEQIADRKLFAFKRQDDVLKLMFGTARHAEVAAFEHIKDEDAEAMREEDAV